MRPILALTLSLSAAATAACPAQMLLDGRLIAAPGAEGGDPVYLGGIRCFATPRGYGYEGLAFRSWETDPAGWFQFSGAAGDYTLGFSEPSDFARPVLVTNVAMGEGERLTGMPVHARFAMANFSDQEWDREAAHGYFQPFVAAGKSVTHVGFKLAADGVDDGGEGAQDLVLSLHEIGGGAPESWPQIGPELPVPAVDCGGPKQYHYSARWNSGEAPTEPGKRYAIRLRAKDPAGTFQAYWSAAADASAACWRVGDGGAEPSDHTLWMAVAGDGDGLLIPYNKRTHQTFGEFAGADKSWWQTWRPQGKSLAMVVCYAAVSGAQPPLSRQRVLIAIHESGPGGKRVGDAKVAVGNGNYTGDASWGVFGAAFAPGEVPLDPGRTYAVRLLSLEDRDSIGGFVNIKGEESNGIAGFNPYRKPAGEDYAEGTATKGDWDDQPFDLDMQIIEYEAEGKYWSKTLREGDALAGVEPQLHKAGDGHIAIGEKGEVVISAPRGGEGEAHAVFKIEGVPRWDQVAVSGEVFCTWADSFDHQCLVGIDPTGQTDDPDAATIQWVRPVKRHSVWTRFSPPVCRPQGEAISVFMLGRTKGADPVPFQATFRKFAARSVETGVPPAAAEAE